MNKNGKIIKCKVCHKEIYISQSRFSFKKYCSRECGWKDKWGFKPRSKNCSECGSLFFINSQIEIQNKYCSIDCKTSSFNKKQKERYDRLKNENVNGICKECKKPFIYTRYFKRTYCSQKCLNDFLSKNRNESNNPNYKSGIYTHKNFQNKKSKTVYKHLNECRRYKKEFIKVNGYQFCELCGINKNGTLRFEVHHIYFASQYPKHKELHNNKNLIHLCLDCHHKFHAGTTFEKEFKKLEKERGLKRLFVK